MLHYCNLLKSLCREFLFFIGFVVAKNSYIMNIVSKIFNHIYSAYYANILKLSSKDNFCIEYPIQNIVGKSYIKIGRNFYSKSGLRLEAIDFAHSSPQLNIGNDVQLNNNVHIGCSNSIYISDGVLIASNVFITDHSHGELNIEELGILPKDRAIFSKGPVCICKNVWIGEHVSILPNVTIGDNSIIGANSVVTRSFPANVVIAGNPAKIIRKI